MLFDIKKHDDIIVIKVFDGKLTAQNAAELRTKLQGFIDDGYYFIILDLTILVYMDSTGIGTLVSVFNYLNNKSKLDKEKSNMVLCNVNKNMNEIFELTRVNQMFDIYDSVPEALNNIKD